jgi:hypothetical protein
MNQIMDFLQSKPVAAACWALGFALCLICSVILMPAAELLPAQVNSPTATAPITPGLSPVRSEPVMDAFKGVAQGLSEVFFGKSNLEQITSEPLPGGTGTTPGDTRAYMLYAIGFGAAMIAAAIAINAVGRYDSEEKTIIPVKK